MYAAVVVSSGHKSISLTLDVNNSFRRLKKFVENGIASGMFKKMLDEVELDGFVPSEVDQIYIVSTEKDKAGHNRVTYKVA